jgi:threonine dehydrogenase-like Zn-dependent dehydrogenase
MPAATVLPAVQQAARFSGAGEIGWWERPVPAPGEDELLVEVRANAICGTERDQLERGADVTPGHEAAGLVAVAGPDTRTPVGTPGVVYLMDFCGACRSCRLGATNQCLAKRADMGFTRDGGYGPFELVHETNFFPIDADLPFAEATLLLDVMGTAGHAIDRATLIRQDVASIAIAGAGPVGLGVVAMSRLLLGPDVPVVVGDVIPFRLRLAASLGGRPVDLRTTSMADGVRSAGLLDGADVAIDTAGRTTTRAGLLEALGKRGVLVCVGHGQTLELDVSADLIAPERSVLGSEYFPFADLERNASLLREHRTTLSSIITHRLPGTQLSAAFELFLAGSTGKVVVER